MRQSARDSDRHPKRQRDCYEDVRKEKKKTCRNSAHLKVVRFTVFTRQWQYFHFIQETRRVHDRNKTNVHIWEA